MTHFYMRRDVYKGARRVANARVSYITRETVQGRADPQLNYIGEGREDCLLAESRNLPGWAGGDPHVFFAAAERYERVNGATFEELKVGLPQELTHAQNIALMRDVVAAIASDKLPVTYAMHIPTTMDGRKEQPHFHLMLSRRITDEFDRGPAQHFKRYNRQAPAKGGAQKDPAFAERHAQRRLRVLCSDVVNVHLERHEVSERVHPGKLSDRGIDRQPEPKLLPSESRAYREDGIVSDRMAEVLAIREARAQTRPQERLTAHVYWEERKAELGILRDMDLSDQVALAVEARVGQKRSTLAAARVSGRTHVSQPPAPKVNLSAQLAALTAQLDRLSEGEGHGTGLKVRLWHGQERDGLSW
jgi:MobA/MobL family